MLPFKIIIRHALNHCMMRMAQVPGENDRNSKMVYSPLNEHPPEYVRGLSTLLV